MPQMNMIQALNSAMDIMLGRDPIVVILGEDVNKAKEYAEGIQVPFPILCDPDREIYHLYELEKYFLLFQRTASLIVDKDGLVRYLKRTTVPNVWLQESRELYGFVDSLNEEQKN